MGDESVIAKSVVGHRYVHMQGKSRNARNVADQEYACMGGLGIGAKCVVAEYRLQLLVLVYKIIRIYWV